MPTKTFFRFDEEVVRFTFAVGLVGLGAYSMYLGNDTWAGVCLGAISGVFTLGKSEGATVPEAPQ